jgi:hypothetical protein
MTDQFLKNDVEGIVGTFFGAEPCELHRGTWCRKVRRKLYEVPLALPSLQDIAPRNIINTPTGNWCDLIE